MSDDRDLLTATAERLLANTSTFEAVERAEADEWSAEVWDALASAGFPWVSISTQAGGSGGTFDDAVALLRVVGRHAAPVPFAETSLLGGWLCEEAGFAIPAGPLTVVPEPSSLSVVRGRLRGEAVVAWARRADYILAFVPGDTDDLIVKVDPEKVAIFAGANLAGEPRDTVAFNVDLADVDVVAAPASVTAESLLMRGMLSRVALMAGALEAMTALTLDYANQRYQFGKPIASFQAVQQHLVTVAQQSTIASIAADVAVRATARGSGRFETLSAKILANDAATLATRAAHQAHGAMGMTREYELHHFSRRLWGWRHEYGTSRDCRRYLGDLVAHAGADVMFPTIAK